MIDFDIRRYDRLGSTSDEARRLASAGARHGTVVTACEQTAGRGRQGRGWVSPAGNLHASILLRLELPAGRSPELGLVAAVAVADTIDACLRQPRSRLKWPNDVLVDRAKLAGILIERAEEATILGIGINVRHAPAGINYAATSLVQAGAADADPESALTALLAALARRLDAWQRDGFAAVRAAWMARAHPVGTVLRVQAGAAVIAGRFAGLASDGALLLETAGATRRVIAGDVAVG